MVQLKYVRLRERDTIVIFPPTLQHSQFQYFDPVSAGFCYIHNGLVECFGTSVSLNLEADPLDSKRATLQFFNLQTT